jgi:hypothetical protein
MEQEEGKGRTTHEGEGKVKGKEGRKGKMRG